MPLLGGRRLWKHGLQAGGGLQRGRQKEPGGGEQPVMVFAVRASTIGVRVEKLSCTYVPNWNRRQRLPSLCLSSCRYQLLHGNIRSSVFVTEVPERVGTLLDHQRGRLAFYNAQSGQLLGSFSQNFTGPCHPVLALEMAGSLVLSMVPEVPEFTGDR